MSNKSYPKCVCLVFGAGLIGGRIITALKKNGIYSSEYYQFSWNNLKQQELQLHTIYTYVKTLFDLINKCSEDTVILAIVWSAGRGGFATREKDLAQEVATFNLITNFTDRLLSNLHHIRPSFHMLSSAGGLFEGQTNVGLTTRPSPQRPYGFSKLEQEELLNTWETDAIKYCYRPSSVYGVPRHGARVGLIPILLQNGMQRQVVNFFGSMNTIRDYVNVDDIAFFISKKIQDTALSNEVFILASTESTTLLQLKLAAECCIRRKIYVNYELSPDNAANNSFLSSVKPKGWQPINVLTGLRQIYAQLLQNGCPSQNRGIFK